MTVRMANRVGQSGVYDVTNGSLDLSGGAPLEGLRTFSEASGIDSWDDGDIVGLYITSQTSTANWVVATAVWSSPSTIDITEIEDSEGTIADGSVVDIKLVATRKTLDLHVDDVNGVLEQSPLVVSGEVTLNLGLRVFSVFKVTLGENVTSVTLDNVRGSGFSSFVLIIAQDDVGTFEFDWPTSFTWDSGTPPEIETSAYAESVFCAFTTDGGTSWKGFLAGEDMG
jgi:hypothetical protein